MRTEASMLGSTLWVYPASVWQDGGQCISAMVDSDVVHTTSTGLVTVTQQSIGRGLPCISVPKKGPVLVA